MFAEIKVTAPMLEQMSQHYVVQVGIDESVEKHEYAPNSFQWFGLEVQGDKVWIDINKFNLVPIAGLCHPINKGKYYLFGIDFKECKDD